MKKTLAIILSIIMLIGVMPFASFAAEPAYDRAAVAANDEAYIADMTAEQMASVILDWVDREIAKYSAEIEDDIVAGVIANGGFEEFEAFLGEDALGNIIAENMPEITSLDAVIGYKSYLAELGGDFAGLDASALITRAEAGSALGFIDGVFEFMAANSETFGKVFRWDEEVFDYGKVGDYIETLNGSENADEQAIYDFYMNYLVGNDIQAKFTKWVADQMGYAIPEGETFDDTLNNGILGWFSGLCYDAETGEGILSEKAYEELLTYNLKTTDIYTLVKNFVALVQSDNQVKIDTYYNYIMDTVVRSLLKTAMGQQAVVGAEAAVPAGFTATYTDLALLEEISGGKAYYYDGTNYYQVAIADGVATANALTWNKTINLETLELPVAKILTGADFGTVVAEYTPTSKEAIKVNLYSSEKNQELIASAVEGFEFTGTEVPTDYAALMVADNAKDLVDAFGLEVVMGEEVITELKLTMAEIEELAEAEALKLANDYLATLKEANKDTVITVPVIGTEISIAEELKNVKIDSVDVTLTYAGWATADEFICQVTAGATASVSGLSDLAKTGLSLLGIDLEAKIAEIVANTIDNPVITIVVDGLSGDFDLDDAKALLDFIDTDFVIDKTIVDFAGNYDANNGVVGQANNILVKLVNMLAAPAGEAKLNLTAGNNDNFTANLQKICDTVNDVMAAAEDVMNNEGLQDIIKEFDIDLSALLGNFDLDILYDIDFSSVEALWVSVITLGLDVIDQDPENEEKGLIDEIHDAIDNLENLDAIAVAIADYVLADCIPALNDAVAKAGFDFALTVPTPTDAKTVADGEGKDIIMTKLVDLVYEAAVEGVALVNSIANDALATIATETGIEMPTVAFELKVEKGADWEATLAALVDRVYGLANGIILACDNEYTDTFDKIAAVANSILPLGSLASNCASENFAFDINLVLGYLFDDGLEGDLDGFLRLFETKTKTEDVAADVSVTEALINASEHIVDAFFPDTVKSEHYVDNYATGKFTEITVQEYFTGAENDAVIASNNMDSLNALKADLVPAALNLVREAGVLPFFAKCDKDHSALTDAEKRIEAGKAATCTEAGVEDAVYCAECGYLVSGGAVIPAAHTGAVNKAKVDSTCTATGTEAGVYCEDCNTWVSGGATIAKKAHSYTWTVTKEATHNATGTKTGKCSCGDTQTETIPVVPHSFDAWKVTKAATCVDKGTETRTCSCGKVETREINATGNHTDANGDEACDVCGKSLADNSFFGKIKAFFQRIIDWFKNLFKF